MSDREIIVAAIVLYFLIVAALGSLITPPNQPKR